MTATYLVQIRLGGPIKRRLREIIQDVADRFHERELVRSHYVPHITLYGTFTTHREKAVLARIRDVCAQFDLVPFRIDGFDHFGRDTIYADVHSSRALRTLRYELSKELRPLTSNETSYDHDTWFKFHSTVARNICGDFTDIWSYVSSTYDLDYDGYVERVTLIRNGNIVKEYSLPQGRFLNGDAATSRPAWKRDETLIERHRRSDDHDDLTPSQPPLPVRYCMLLSDWISSRPENHRTEDPENREPQTFLSGDLHLNHGNIIEYCDRPFSSVHEMNQELITNWNDTVRPDDTVVFLGDLCFYYGNITTHDWLHALNGNIVYIRGNHDEAKSIDYEDEYILETGTRRYYCTHKPADVPDSWDGWVIHGHLHNNDIENYPFINPISKQINAAPELMGYTPCNIERVEKAIEDINGPVRGIAELSQTH